MTTGKTKENKESALSAPFPYFGGKRNIAEEVWRRLGNPTTYVEPFAGSMAVLLARPDSHEWWSRRETVNDASGHIVNFYRAVTADPETVALHANWPVSELDLTARHLDLVERQQDLAIKLGADATYFDPEMAGWWVWGISAWVGGEWCSGLGPLKRGSESPGVYRKMPMSAASHGGKGIHRQLPSPSSRLISESESASIDKAIFDVMLPKFEAIAQRLRRVRILCGDWQRTTKSVSTPSGRDVTGLFLDPPYALSDRRANLYGPEDRSRVKKKESDAGEARDIYAESRDWALSLTDFSAYRVAFCTYRSDDEDALFEAAGWTPLAWTAAGGYGLQSNRRARTNRQREVVWFSPSCLPDKEYESLDSDSLRQKLTENTGEDS